MAYTAPTIRATGDLITASIYNTDIVNNIIYLNSRGAPITGNITGSTGATAAGTGFTSSRTAVGTYTITYSPALSAAPAVAITPIEAVTKSTAGIIYSNGTNSTGIKIFDTSVANLGTLIDQSFLFIATPLV